MVHIAYAIKIENKTVVKTETWNRNNHFAFNRRAEMIAGTAIDPETKEPIKKAEYAYYNADKEKAKQAVICEMMYRAGIVKEVNPNG